MFSGFKLNIDSNFHEFYQEGQKLYESTQNSITQELRKYIGPKGIINGTELQKDWFPEIDAHVFISHSHADKNIAISLAGWLKKKFGLISFIDSCVWGYANNLLQEIDEQYSVAEKKSDFGLLYDYGKTTYSSSHVHMMLAIALLKMIDKAESVFFLNTPNSVVLTKEQYVKDIIKQRTESPWLYFETTAMNLVRKKDLGEYRTNKEFFDFCNEGLQIRYDISLKDLYTLNQDDLKQWHKEYRDNPFASEMGYPLDYLYNIKNVFDLVNV